MSGVPRFMACGTFAGYVGSAVDVTSHRLAEQTLSALSRKLMRSHEAERSWLGRHLHDDVGQRIALVTIDLDKLGQQLDGGGDARAQVLDLRSRAIDLGNDLQVLSSRLHSSKLEYLGIAAAAAGFCRDVSHHDDVAVDFSHEAVPANVPNDVALGLFRVLEEAVSNAVRHSGVRHVAVSMRGSPGEIELRVEDGGVGFDANRMLNGHGLGLIAMQQRLGSVNGEVHVDSSPGGGTRIRARVPLATHSVYAGDRANDARGERTS